MKKLFSNYSCHHFNYVSPTYWGKMAIKRLQRECNFWISLSTETDNNANGCFNDNVEQRRYSNGTEEDYHTLFTLKMSDYKNLPLADFNSALLEWINENYERMKRMKRISEDTGWNDLISADIRFI